jgi:hypothetical protein
MKKISLVILWLCFVLLPISLFAESRVAILNLKNEAGLKTVEIGFLSDVVREVFSKVKQKNQFHIMTRENINALLDKPLEECISENECEITLGRNLQAQILVTGDVLKIGDKYRFFLRIYDVKSAKLLGSESGRAINIDELEKEIKSASVRLTENIVIVDHDSAETPVAKIEKETTETIDPPMVKSDLVGDTIGINQGQMLDRDIKQGFGIAEKYAMIILQIENGSEAALAGLKVEDILLMNQISSLEQLNEYLRNLAFYETAKFSYLRNVDGEQKRFEVSFMKRPYLIGGFCTNGTDSSYHIRYRLSESYKYDKNYKNLPLSQYLQTKYKLKDIYSVGIDSINQKDFHANCNSKDSSPGPWDAHYKDHKFFVRITVEDKQYQKSSYFVNLVPNQYYVWDRYACNNCLY